MTATLLLRTLAALLIVNSHLESYYPVRPLAADGLLGDTLFFALSGYGLALSARKGRRGFFEWYGRRISRIYPALLTAVLVFDCALGGGWSTWGASDYVLNLAWGRSYPFVGQILVFYVAFYLLTRAGRPGLFPAVFCALFLPYPLLRSLGRGRGDAVFHAFHWLFYFQAMLLGAWIANRPDPGGRVLRRDLAAFAGLGLVYLGVRAGVAIGPLRDWYFLPHVLVLGVTVLLFRLAGSEAVNGAIGRRPWVLNVLGFVGGITLEIYLMHYQVLAVDRVRAIAFPFNVAVLFLLSIAAAAALAGAVRVLTARAGWLGPAVSRAPRPAAEIPRPA